MNHVKNTHKVGPIPVAITYFRCDRCSGVNSLQSDKQSLIAHIYKSHGLMKVEFCSKCSYASTTEGMLQKHINNAHMKVKDGPTVSLNKQVKVIDVKNARKGIGDTPSPSPNKRVRVIEVGRNIVMSKLPGQSFKCEQCPYVTVTRQGIRQHMKANHEGFACRDRNLSFALENQLKAHNSAYHNHADKDQCESTMEVQHQNGASTLLKRVKCETVTKVKTVVVKRPKQPERPFKCEHCPYTAITNSSLEGHVRSNHEGFACQECGKSFGLENQLKAHNSAYHNHVDKYRCESTMEVTQEVGASTLIKRVKCEYSAMGKKDFEVRLKNLSQLELKSYFLTHFLRNESA